MDLKPKSAIKQRLPKLSIAKQQANDYGLIATSYHESSHAIIGLISLLMVDEVNIVDSQEGDTKYFIYQAEDADDENLKYKIIMSELKTIYAGLVGEKAYYENICGSSRFPSHLKNGSSIDTKVASDLIRRYKLAAPGKATFKLKQELKEEVRYLLLKHWDAVKIVAHALYKKKKLNYSEIKYLLTRTSNDKDFWKDKFKKIKIVYDEKNDISSKAVKNALREKIKI